MEQPISHDQTAGRLWQIQGDVVLRGNHLRGYLWCKAGNNSGFASSPFFLLPALNLMGRLHHSPGKMMLVLHILFLVLPCWVVASWSDSGIATDSIADAGGLLARQQAAAPCRLNYTTDVWTGCDDVLAQFGISLDQFRLANPGIGDACDGFVPGKTYCVAACESSWS